MVFLSFNFLKSTYLNFLAGASLSNCQPELLPEF